MKRLSPRAGFTLIELLAVILIIGILAAALTPMVNDAIQNARRTACQQNLRKIREALLYYQTTFGEGPSEPGVKLFAQTISRGAIENSKANAEMMTCPAIERKSLTIGTIPWEEWWTDLEMIDGSYSAYAGRDTREYPFRKFPPPASEAMVADDNDGGMNHRTTTNVLFGDGNVQTYELKVLEEQGLVPKELGILYVGPDSPVEPLRKLTLVD